MTGTSSLPSFDKEVKESNRAYIGTGIFLVLAVIISFSVTSAQVSYVIDGDMVFIDDANAYISATPHTLTSSGWVYFNVTSKAYSGDIDAVWGFDTDNAKPSGAEIYKPEYYNITRSMTCPEPYWYNYTADPKHVWCWYDVEGDASNGTEPYTELVWEHSFEWADLPLRTIYWNEIKYREWHDISGAFNKINYDFDGKDTWYYKKDILIIAGQSYLIRAWIDVPLCLASDPDCESNGKYDFAIKPSHLTIHEAIEQGVLYFLDPWWNSSMTRWPVTYTGYDNPFLLNRTSCMDVGGGKQCVWCDNTTTYAYNDTGGKIHCANDTAQVGTFIDEGNGTSYGQTESSLSHFLGLDCTATDCPAMDRYNHSGTPINTPVEGTGYIGKSQSFTAGSSEYITLPYSPPTAAFTINAWIRPEGSAFQGTIVAWGDNAGHAYQFTKMDSTDLISYGEYDGVYTQIVSTSAIIVDGVTWTMATITKSGTNATIYINGIFNVSGIVNEPVTPVYLCIGAVCDGSPFTFWNGSIDNVQIWNRTLSPAEIYSMYVNNATVGAIESPPSADAFYATTQISPGNATFVSTNPPGDFCFNYTGTYATASCELWIGSTGYGVNTSTLNATTTCITANNSVASDGTYDWLINCTNSTDSNISLTWEFYVDTTPPAITYNTSTSAATACGSVDWIFIGAYITDTNIDNVSYSFNGVNHTGAAWNGSNSTNYWVNYTGLPDGIYTFYVWANDSAGHYNISTSRTVTIDTTPPQIVITSPLNQTYTTAIEDLMFTSSVDYPDGYSWYSFNGAANVSTVRNEWTFIKHTDIYEYFPDGTPSGSAWNGTHLFIGRTSSSSITGTVDIFRLDNTDISWERNFSTVANGPQHLWDTAYNDDMLYMTNWTGITGSKAIYVYHTNSTYNTSFATTKEPIAICSVDGEDYIYIMQNDIGGDKIYERWKNNGTATGIEYASDASITDPAMACDSEYFWVTDTSRDVWKYYRNGTFISKVRPGDTIYIFPLKTSHYMISSSLISSMDPTDYLDFYYADTHINATNTPVQGSNSITVYANDSCGNLNSSTVSFYVDTHAPTISGISQTPITCVSSPGVVRMTWQQQDNLDDLTVYCNFTNAAGASTVITNIVQTANSTSSCSLLLASLGQWDIVVNITDFAGNTILHTGSVESRVTCSGEAGGGGGGSGVITSPIDVVITFFPTSEDPAYVYDPITGRFIPVGISIEDLTPLQQFEAGILVPRFMQVCFEFNATGTDGATYQLTHCALLFSIGQLLLTLVVFLYLWFVRRKRKKWVLQDWLLLATYIIFMFVSITTAFPPEIINAMLGTGSFVPVVEVPTIATGPEVTTSAPPAATADWGPALYEAIQGNPLAILGTIIIIIAAWYIYRNQKESRKLAKRIKHFYER